MTKKKILVAVELEGWQRTLEIARGFASAFDAEMVLVHVVRPMVNVYPDLPAKLFLEAQHEVEKASRTALDQIAKVTGGLRVIVRAGDPAEEILATVAEERPELLVLGTHGRRGIQRLLLGSVAARVLRQCPVPVVTVTPEHGSDAQRIGNETGRAVQ